MPDQATTYQCPSCTGPLHFAGASGMLECDHCGTRYAVEEIERMQQDKEARAAAAWDASRLSGDWGADADAMRAYACPSCGAELLCDGSTAASSCPYCGNPTVVPGKLSGALKPDFVIPFRLSREDAVSALKKHCRGKPFLPRSFTAENHVQKIQGIYVPFWLFDGEAEGDAHFDASRTHTTREGHDEVTRTEHFNVYRAGTVAFEKVPVDASSKLPDDYMDSIEPFDYAELKPFSTAYLPGFLADRYDISAEQSAERADARCAAALTDALRDTVTGYDGCTVTAQSCTLRRGRVRYALLPVWMLNTRWNGRDYLFAMNGQTGRFVGDLPMSWGRFWGLFAAIAAPLAAIGTAMALWL